MIIIPGTLHVEYVTLFSSAFCYVT
jgi:hypothetical protein